MSYQINWNFISAGNNFPNNLDDYIEQMKVQYAEEIATVFNIVISNIVISNKKNLNLQKKFGEYNKGLFKQENFKEVNKFLNNYILKYFNEDETNFYVSTRKNFKDYLDSYKKEVADLYKEQSKEIRDNYDLVKYARGTLNNNMISAITEYLPENLKLTELQKHNIRCFVANIAFDDDTSVNYFEMYKELISTLIKLSSVSKTKDEYQQNVDLMIDSIKAYCEGGYKNKKDNKIEKNKLV